MKSFCLSVCLRHGVQMIKDDIPCSITRDRDVCSYQFKHSRVQISQSR